MLVIERAVAVLAGTAVPAVKVSKLVFETPSEQLVVVPPREQETELEKAS